MIASWCTVETNDVKKELLEVTTNDRLQCIIRSGHKLVYSKVKLNKTIYEKVYNIYFLGGTLCCTFKQPVLCAYNKVLTIGEALINKLRIHTSSGLILPTSIENGKKSSLIDISPPSSKAVLVESVYCVKL